MHDVDSQFSSSTTMVGYLFGIIGQLQLRDIEAACILRSAGIFNRSSNDPLNRFASVLLPEILRLAVQVTGNPYFGLQAMQSVKAQDLHVLGLGLLASESILCALQRLTRLSALIGGSGKLILEGRSASFRLTTVPSGPVSTQAQDAWLSCIFSLMCQVSDAPPQLLSVDLMHSRRHRSIEPYEKRFGAPVHFGSTQCALEFAKDPACRILRAGCEELANLHDEKAMAYLVRLHSSDVVTQVQLAIMDCLKDAGCVSLESIAQRTALRERQIQQGLSKYQTDYQRVLDQTRMHLAKLKLNDHALQVSEVAHMLGFTDSANFSRAFKRWTGESPLYYRRRASAGRY